MEAFKEVGLATIVLPGIMGVAPKILKILYSSKRTRNIWVVFWELFARASQSNGFDQRRLPM